MTIGELLLLGAELEKRGIGSSLSPGYKRFAESMRYTLSPGRFSPGNVVTSPLKGAGSRLFRGGIGKTLGRAGHGLMTGMAGSQIYGGFKKGVAANKLATHAWGV